MSDFGGNFYFFSISLTVTTLAGFVIFLLLEFATGLVFFPGKSVWDDAPYYAADPIQPFPSLTDDSGKTITLLNLCGTRLYGFKGCPSERSGLIKRAYKDFHDLAAQDGVSRNFDWNGQAATDFFGPAASQNPIPDGTRKEIEDVLKRAEQIWSYWWAFPPPFFPPRALWIEVRCSDGKKGAGAPDVNDACGDAEPDSETCPNGQPVNVGSKRTLQAFSDNSSPWFDYSRITFCTDFFKLQELSVITENTKRLPAAKQINLENWDNQARVFFHEIMHLDYFVNTGDTQKDPSKNPFITDVEMYYLDEKVYNWHDAYGAWGARMLRNYVDNTPEGPGYFTQRSAENYAWFAMAKYVEGQIGQYPTAPSVGRRRPLSEPKDATRHKDLALDLQVSTNDSSEDIPETEGDSVDLSLYPGCADRDAGKADTQTASDSDQQPPSTTAPPPPPPSTTTVSPPPPPTTSAPPPVGDHCGAWYNFWYDNFEIYGKNFDSDKLGAGGLNLLADLRNCGAVDSWEFHTVQNDPNGMQWKATGTLPIGQISCIGSAVLKAGGNTADGCTGAG